MPFLWFSGGVNRGSSGRIQARFGGDIKAIPVGFDCGADGGLDAAVEAEKAGGEQLRDVLAALVGGGFNGVPRHDVLPAARSQSGC